MITARSTTLAAAALLCLASLSCSEKSPADFGGQWPGFVSDAAGAVYPTSLDLTQSGDTVTGTIAGYAALTGKVDGDSLAFTLDLAGTCGAQASGSGKLEKLADRDRVRLSFQGVSTCSGTIAASGWFERMRCPAPTVACAVDYVTEFEPYCADVANDEANCGACRVACHDLQACVAGACQVPACAGPVPLEAPRSFDAGGGFSTLVLADVDGDSRTDAVMSGCIPAAAAGEACRSAVFVLRGDGDGGFSPPVASDLVALFPSDPAPPDPIYVPPPPMPYVPSAIAVGDLDGDGRPDLAAYEGPLPYPWTGTGGDEVLTLLGNGDGSFRAGERFPTGGVESEFAWLGRRVLALADLNGDGVADLAARVGATAAVRVRLGTGDGTLGPPSAYALPGTAEALGAADLDGDGAIDLAVATYPSGVAVLLGNGDGTFGAPLESPGVWNPHDLAVADLDEDGVPDLALVAWYPPYGVPNVVVLLGRGDGTFEDPLPVEEHQLSSTSTLSVADLDGDGHLDLSVGDMSRGLELFLGSGDGTFAPFEHPIFGGARLVGAADLDRDGRIDLVAGGAGSDELTVLRACAP